MMVKIGKGGSHTMYPCTHVVQTGLMPKIHGRDGIEVELRPNGPTLRLPDDGNVIYVMDDLGNTMDIYRWPPRNRKES